MVLEIGDVQRTILGEGQGHRLPELPRSRTRGPDAADEPPVDAEHEDTVAARVGQVQLALSVDRERASGVRPVRLKAERAHHSAVRVEMDDAVVHGVDDEQVSAIRGQAGDVVQHKVRAETRPPGLELLAIGVEA